MMKIRIGNDICLDVNLLGNKNIDAININSINAYLINVTKYEDLLDQHTRELVRLHDEMDIRRSRIKYVSRFPVEPVGPDFRPTPHDICGIGRPGYHVHPHYYVPVYPGFGVWPHTFEPYVWCRDDMHDIYMDAGHKYMDMHKEYDRCRFLAPVEATESKNKVKVFFPAEAQLYTGVYKLLIVAKIYEPGYMKDNLRTVTMDYENVFELVSKSDLEGMDGSQYISIGNSKQASYINVTGDTALRPLQTGRLLATVYPTDLDIDGVTWEVSGEDRNFLPILTSDDHTCTFQAQALPQGVGSRTCTVRVRSIKTPTIYVDVPVTISDSIVNDIYTYQGNLDNNNVNLNLTDGRTVNVDVSKETAWYEGD